LLDTFDPTKLGPCKIEGKGLPHHLESAKLGKKKLKRPQPGQILKQRKRANASCVGGGKDLASRPHRPLGHAVVFDRSRRGEAYGTPAVNYIDGLSKEEPSEKKDQIAGGCFETLIWIQKSGAVSQYG